jgi:hypothetical protein
MSKKPHAENAMEVKIDEDAFKYVKYLIGTSDSFEDTTAEEIAQLHEIMEIGIKFYIYALRRRIRNQSGNDTLH